ncbi:MAG TPA: ABC transporter permease, partial [Anaerolineales bacterium]|nr:ABC transporter permease [Anaerolineales bacterium]
FLDEPTSGLDPGTETALMQLMRRLADAGRTIVLITHATKNVMLADKVIFLARGGYLVWFGPPDEALAYFDQYRSERDRRAGNMEFDEIYAVLDDSSKSSPTEWAERFKQTAAYQKYIADELAKKAIQPVSRQEPAKKSAKPARKVSTLRQFFILSSRNIKILTRDKFSLMLMLAAAPIVGMLDFILAGALGRNPFAFADGDFAKVLITLFLMTIYGVMIGGLSQMREIVKESDIYKRERLVNLKIVPYVLSKIWVAGLLALYQTLCYVVIRYIAFDMPGGTTEAVLIYISLALATMAGMMLGLFASALAPNANSAPLLVILLMLPQIVLGGALIPLPDTITSLTSTRWAFQGMMAITGAGSDVAQDACWLLAEETVELMTIEDRTALCNCMGLNTLREGSCNFPGLGVFYTPIIDEERPPDPPAEPTRPPSPIIPPPPPEPVDQSDTVAVAEYLTALQAYQAEVAQIQADAEADFATFEGELEVYRAQVVAAQEALITWEGTRQAAVLPAEGLIAQFNRDFGWTFVNQEDTGTYYGTLFNTWAAQGVIMAILFVAVLVLQKRKDI